MKKKRIIFLGIIFVLFLFYIIFPYFINVNIKDIPNSIVVYDENNYEIGEIIRDGKYRHRNVKLDEVPNFLKESLINVEDRRFYYHSGIDYLGILRAMKNNIFGNSLEGASTLENQIIRNNYWLNEKRTYKLKIKEFILSLALNKKYTKNEILEKYINTVNFGYLNFGFESASKFYFNKSLNNLTKAEIIGLITIIKNSNKYNPITNLSNFNKRFKVLVNYLYKKEIIGESEKNEILAEKFIFKDGQENLLPYIIDFVGENIKEVDSGKIVTTFDYNLTKKIDEIAKSSIKDLAWKNVSDYSIIIINRNTSELKVMIGGQNYYGEDGQVNGTLAFRQPGSTLKPFLYLLAFRDLGKTPSSTILDLPVSYLTSDGNLYEPKNYSLEFSGEVSLAESLSQSINVPAVKLLNEIGINEFMLFLKNLGITSINEDADFYGLSLALGSGEVSLYELTKAYQIFVNDGKICDSSFVKGEDRNCGDFIDKKYTDMVVQVLTNRYFKLKGFPINSNLDFPNREVFVKTGTSRNFRDNWSIGYTNDYVIGVWVGNKDGSEMKGVSGVSGAGEIFRKIVYFLDDNETNPKVILLEKDTNDFIQIISPLDKSVYKIDDSIPIDSQKIKLEFKTNIDYDEEKWFLNDEKIEKDFLKLKDLKSSNILKIQLFKNSKIVGNDEVSLEVVE